MSDGSVIIDTKLDNEGFSSGLNKIKGIASAGCKTIAASIGTVATAFTGMVTASVNARGELEQQLGGVETLFKNSADKVIKNANNAYKTAGMSANEYMQNVTSFSASLLQSVAGDTDRAADTADMALQDMSDNANKMGTSMESITAAYQGFAKQNYTMLDNLKLGYGGTKTEMQRLLKDAQKITGVKYDISNLNDVYTAIHVIQGELGITGTTAKEASATLQGSMAAASAAWQNFLSGSGDLSQVVTSATDVVNNVVRITSEAVPSIAEGIVSALPQLLELGGKVLNELINGIVTYLPNLMTSAGQILNSLAQGIIQVLPQLIPTALQVIQMLVTGLISYLPQILQMGIQILSELITGIAQMLPELIPMAIDCIITLVNTILDNIDQLIDAGIEILLGLVDGIIEALPRLIDQAPVIIQKLFDALVRNFPKIVSAGGELIGKLAMGILGSIFKLVEVAPKLISTIVDGLKNGWEQIKNIGKYLVEGLWNGITGAAGWLADKVKSFASNILNNMKEAMGIHSPSRLFRDEVGKYIALGVGEGFEDNISKVYKQMKAAVDFETQKLSTNITTAATLNADKDNIRTIQTNNDNGVVVNQNFYEKVQSPYETAKQTKNMIRSVAYGI